MNLIYIHTHDSGRYFEPYGYPMKTPNIQKLAEESVVFRNAYCCAPTCSPSRTAMLTGQYAHTSGMLGLAHRGFYMTNPERHISFYLRSQGFETVFCGIQHESVVGDPLGYTRILSDARGMRQSKSTVEWDKQNAGLVCDYLQEKHLKPFFLTFGMFNTHRPYPSHKKKINPNYVRPAWPIADTPENREDIADYMTSVSCVDDCVGMVLNIIKSTGLDKDTLVLFTTDHGIAMPFMKCNLYDTGTGVALMLRYPGNKGFGEVRDQLVSHVDVYPTLCDILGVHKPSWLQGVSLLPVINENKLVRNEVFSEVTYHAAYEPKRSVRSERYKLIRHYDYHNQVVPANIDASSCKDYLVRNGYLETSVPKEEMYDLALDPVERINLINDSRYKDVYSDLSSKLYKWMQETDDPLLKYEHRVPMPKGAHVNKLDSIEPNETEWEDPDQVQ